MRTAISQTATVQLPRAARQCALIGLAIFRLVVFVLTLTPLSVVVRVLLVTIRPFTARETRWRVGATILRRTTRFVSWLFGVRVRRHGISPPPGTLMVANHHSYLDILALCAASPTHFLAKKELESWPLFGPGARAVGILFVRRGDRKSGGQAAISVRFRLAAGVSVVNFPEGTTTSGELPGPFKIGLFHHIAGEQIAVVPVRLRYQDVRAHWIGDDTFVGHLVRLASRPVTRVHVTYGAPIDASGHDPDELRRLCWRRVAAGEPYVAASHLTWLEPPHLLDIAMR